jgi:adenine deaminase
MQQNFRIFAHTINIVNKTTFPCEVVVENGKIVSIEPCDEDLCSTYILPGFIDAHVHIESSLLVPSEFARMAVLHGMVGTVSDPHEIANVLGVKGVEYMLEDAAQVPFHFFFGAPSCVPATQFETAGATLDVDAVSKLLLRSDIWYLAEMMNYPGVIQRDPDVMAKIAFAHQYHKPVDGHAPGLRGNDMKLYASAGIVTDHECFTLDEAIEKINAGMIIQIREGSAARNFEALHPLLKLHPEKVMFCSDDKHPDSLMEGHINLLVKRALALNYDLYDVLRAASLHVRNHYKLLVGMLQVGDQADFIEIDHPNSFQILRTWIRGECVAEIGKSNIKSVQPEIVNQFIEREIDPTEIEIIATEQPYICAIEAFEGQLITGSFKFPHGKKPGEKITAFPKEDVLKIVVVNRYENKPPAVAFIKNLGLISGAFASTVAHDSHNIIAAGCDDEAILKSIRLLMANKGGLAAVNESKHCVLPLPVAGLMSNLDAWKIANEYIQIDQFVKEKLGSPLRAPFMTLSFMALLVIPELKLSDKGLFDGKNFRFCSPFVA